MSNQHVLGKLLSIIHVSTNLTCITDFITITIIIITAILQMKKLKQRVGMFCLLSSTDKNSYSLIIAPCSFSMGYFASNILSCGPFIHSSTFFLGLEDPLEEELAPCSSVLAWKIPWAKKPGGLYIVHGATKDQMRLSE